MSRGRPSLDDIRKHFVKLQKLMGVVEEHLAKSATIVETMLLI
jgi:hypothetical protein